MCIDCVKTATLAAMVAKAEELGVQGVAWVLIRTPEEDSEIPSLWMPFVAVVGRFYREADSNKGDGDTGANYFNVAASKIGEMLETGLPSGTADRPSRKGEFGYKGGVIYILEDDTVLHTAFSGGTEAQDVQIAEAGMTLLQRGMEELGVANILAEKAQVAVTELELTIAGSNILEGCLQPVLGYSAN